MKRYDDYNDEPRQYETFYYEDDEDAPEDYEPCDDGQYEDGYEDEYEDEYEDGYEDEYEEEYEEPAPPPRKTPKKSGKTKKKARRRKKRHGLRNIILFLLILALAILLLGEIPGGKRGKSGEHCTVLLAGTDAEGYRTDTIMLLSLDRTGGSIRLLSIPRDTYVSDYYTVPKINSAMGVGGGGESGMEELLRQVEKVLGFAPDGYALIHLDAFVRAVDALGGVDFDVPMDMQYVDPDQDLVIDLRAGEQHLDGYQAMGLVRFRSGYATADIGRTEVQRQFIKSALKQWIGLRAAAALPELLQIYKDEVLTDLSIRNLLWMGVTVLKTGISSMETDLLPGYAAMAGDASVWMVDSAAAAEILPAYDPYD